MGRSTSPVFKISRRLGFSILENNKEFSKGKKREYGPGQHGNARRRRVSPYGSQLLEKQKLRHLYQVSETQLRNLYQAAERKPGLTSLTILVSLETRLDNIIFRFGLASTRRQARQLVNHGHIFVNDKKVDIPSYTVKIGQKISISGKAKEFKLVKEALESKLEIPTYVEFNRDNFEGKLIRLPDREELNPEIKENLIVEYYNRLL